MFALNRGMVELVVVGPSSVKHITSALRKRIPVVILYKMNGCPHCEMMRGAWDACKKRAKMQKKAMCIGEVEYSQINILPLIMRNVGGFPTIKVFKGNEVLEYSGDRSEGSLSMFVMSHMAPHQPSKVDIKPKAKRPRAPSAQKVIKPSVKPKRTKRQLV